MIGERLDLMHSSVWRTEWEQIRYLITARLGFRLTELSFRLRLRLYFKLFGES